VQRVGRSRRGVDVCSVADTRRPNPTIPDGMHDWTLSAALMAKVLAEKGYHYQYLFARNAKHVDRPTVAQTLPAALEWLWKGFPIP
jgi:hypothetical protein